MAVPCPVRRAALPGTGDGEPGTERRFPTPFAVTALHTFLLLQYWQAFPGRLAPSRSWSRRPRAGGDPPRAPPGAGNTTVNAAPGGSAFCSVCRSAGAAAQRHSYTLQCFFVCVCRACHLTTLGS
jgi:hypothetical protein